MSTAGDVFQICSSPRSDSPWLTGIERSLLATTSVPKKTHTIWLLKIISMPRLNGCAVDNHCRKLWVNRTHGNELMLFYLREKFATSSVIRSNFFEVPGRAKYEPSVASFYFQTKRSVTICRSQPCVAGMLRYSQHG